MNLSAKVKEPSAASARAAGRNYGNQWIKGVGGARKTLKIKANVPGGYMYQSYDSRGPVGNKFFKTGGFTGKGRPDELAGLVHAGEYVFRHDQVDQSTGLPKTSALLSMLGNDLLTNGRQLPSTPATSNTKITNVFSPDGILLVELLPTQMQQIARMVATAPTAPSFDASSVAHAVNQINEIQTNRGNG